MNYYDNESNIINLFQRESQKSVLMADEMKYVFPVFQAVHDAENWKTWINSSGKSDPPPDFYSDHFQLMMDVMRVDDHTRVDTKGKVYNPVNQRESKIQKELRAAGILRPFPNVKAVMVNAVTDLPTEEDHNYEFYYTSFIRTIEKHIKSIPIYKANHPGFKVIFFIFDESSGYVLPENPGIVHLKKNQVIRGKPHLCFMDKRFVEVFRETEIDYVIWYAPNKYIQSNMPVKLPNVAIYDVKNHDYSELIDYPKERMCSLEE